MDEAEQKRQRDLEHLRKLRPIDDDFMRCMFKDNIPLAQLVLRIITGIPDLVITECQTQKDLKRLVGARSVILDFLGIDTLKRKYNMEIQRNSKHAEPERARYHISIIDVESLDARQDFRQLPETYVIFITEKDFFGLGEPIYPIERINLLTGNPFGDRAHILYVNGEYRGNSDIGKLMHDFNCTEADEMNFELMAERTRYLKENPKGVGEMCKIFEDIREEGIQIGKQEGIQLGKQEGSKETVRSVALRMLEAEKYALEEIAAVLNLPLDDVKKLQTEQLVSIPSLAPERRSSF